MSLVISVTGDPNADDLAAIGNGLAAFNEQDVGPADRLPLAVLIHDEARKVVAGISSYTAWGWLYVQWLWVDDAYRGEGLAKRMLGVAEGQARLRGCHGAYIDTFSPIALKVYLRQGYEPFGVLEDFPRGRARTFLQKKL